MFRITRLSNPTDPVARLRVEGRLVGRSASELVRASQAARTDGKLVLLDLAGVAFVDAEGARAIAELSAAGVTPIGCSPFVSATLRLHARAQTDLGEHDDPALVARLRDHDAAAFEELVRRCGPRLLAAARRLLRSDDDAAAAVQEGCRTAFAAIATLPGNATLWTWLHRLVTNAALIRLGRRRHEPEESLEALLPRFDETGHWADGVPPLDLPADALARRDTRRLVGGCIDRLPEAFRTILLLRDVEDLDPDEIAGLLGTTTSVVGNRLHHARQALRTLLAAALEAGRTRSP